MAIHRVDLIIEAKEDETIEGIQPQVPDLPSAAVAVQDTMTDLTKHDAYFGWRITRVEPVAAGTALVSAADLSHVLDFLAGQPFTGMSGPELDCYNALRRDLEASWNPAREDPDGEHELGGEG